MQDDSRGIASDMRLDLAMAKSDDDLSLEFSFVENVDSLVHVESTRGNTIL